MSHKQADGIVGLMTSERSVLFWLVAVSLFMTLKYFPGLENPAAYAGNVFQSIYPESFPGDPYIGPNRSFLEKPYKLSLFYLLPTLMGEIWLDDRFVVIVYFGLVFASVVGIDKIAQAMGLDDIFARVVLQLVYMRDHTSLTQSMTFAHQPDVNHAAFAIPVHIWLIYCAVTRKSIWLVIGMAVLLSAISIKNAPYTVAYTLLIAAILGSKRDRIMVGTIFAAALALFVVAVLFILPIPDADRLELWNLTYAHSQRFIHANPFYPASVGLPRLYTNIEFLLICLFAIFLKNYKSPVTVALRIFVVCGLIVWFLGGLYYTFSPDFLKSPHVMMFSLARNLRWPQTIAYLLIMVGIFRMLQSDKSARSLTFAWIAFGLLLAVGPGNHLLWLGLYVVSSVVVLTAFLLLTKFANIESDESCKLWKREFESIVGNPNRYLMVSLLVCICVAFSTTIVKRGDAWLTLVNKGVIGDSSSAIWIDVAEYVRNNTPADAVVLPLQYDPRSPDVLKAKRYLSTRSGRATPVINENSDIFNLAGWTYEFSQRRLLQEIANDFQSGDWKSAKDKFSNLSISPRYVVLPKALLRTNRNPFVLEKIVNGFGILRLADTNKFN